MKKYPDCMRSDGMCGICSLVSRGLDCRNNKINGLLYQRSSMGMTQKDLAEKSGVNIRQIQRYEAGTSGCENMTLKNAIAIADALECDVRDLL